MSYGTDAVCQNVAQFLLSDDSLGELQTIETLMRVGREIEQVAHAGAVSHRPYDRGCLGGADN